MKRTWIVVALAICLAAALGAALGACGGGGGDIVGVWSDSQGMDFNFAADGALVISVMGQNIELQYTVKDGKLFIAGADPSLGIPEEIKYRVDGGKLVMTSPKGEEQTLVKK